MGEVYGAFDREREMRVALKRLRPLGPEYVQRFKNEFRAQQDLHHPNLVSLGELFLEEGEWFFTMELVEGVSFIDWVRPPPPGSTRDTPRTITDSDVVPPTREMQYGVLLAGGQLTAAYDEARLRGALGQLAGGLNSLHAARKVHRDLKPSNVLVTEAGRVVILDLGLVTDMRAANTDFVGTVQYMAPEQAARQPVGPASDWYAVGVMIYQALMGTVPFSGPPPDVLRIKQRLLPTPPHDLLPLVPPDLDVLCMELLQIDPADRPSGVEVLRALGLPAGEDDALHATFVGRDAELLELSHALDDARDGRTVSVVVHGESGIGKTALLEHFLARVQPSLVLAGRCYEREAVPFKAFDELMDRLVDWLSELPENEAIAILPPEAPVLAQLFPVLKGLKPLADTSSTIVDPRQVQKVAFTALRQLLRAVAVRRQLVLAIDDFQWADADSLTLLGELLRQPGAPPLLLVATMRTTSEPDPSMLTFEQVRAVLHGAVRPLEVAQLPPASARRLAELLLPSSDQPAGDADRIVREAGGHPLFIDALVRHRLTLGSQAGPARLDEALRARVAGFAALERHFMELIAVAGTRTPIAPLATAIGVNSDEAGQLAARLGAAHLVRVHGIATIEPFHDRVREAVTASLSPEDRRARHQQLAAALEGTADAETLARHYHGAGDDVQAARYAARGADQALAVLAFYRAAQLCRWALELVPADSSERAVLLTKLGDALAYAGRGQEAADAYLAAGNGLELRRRAAEQLLTSGHMARGLALLDAVLVELKTSVPETPRRALASLLWHRARVRLRGTSFAEQPNPPAEALHEVDSYWSASKGLAMVDNIRGADFQCRCLLSALKVGDPSRVARSLGIEVCFVSTLGYASRKHANRLIAEARKLAERTKDPYALAYALSGESVNAFLQGRWRDGYEGTSKTLTLYRERCVNVAWEVSSMQLFELWCLWNLGDNDEVARRMAAYVAEADERGDVYAGTTVRLFYGNATWLAHDDPERARAELKDAMARWSAEDSQLARYRGYKLQHHYALYADAQVDLYLDDGVSAVGRIDDSWSGLDASLLLRIQQTRIAMREVRARAHLSVAARDREEHADSLRLACKDAKKLRGEGAPWATAHALLIEAAAASLSGDDALALKGFSDAATAYAAAEMPLHAAAARRRHGALTKGDAGAAEVLTADDALRTHGVRNPARFAKMLAPGAAD